MKPLYGHQEGAQVSYHPHKPGRPSHSYHSYMLANLRLALAVEVQPGKEHTAKHSALGLWELVDGLAAEHKPALIRDQKDASAVLGRDRAVQADVFADELGGHFGPHAD